jgi:Na+-transporting NADH:ubiquinone oxidoreductase subunit C
MAKDKKDSTGYILSFAAGVCLVCSVFVAGAAVSLKDKQEANKLLDKQKKVLVVAGLMDEGEKLPPAEVSQLFADNIVPKVVELKTGAYVDGVNADTFDQRKASKDPEASTEAEANPAKVMRVPNNALVYHVVSEGEVQKLILPIEGKGLWSTLYGFIALETDTNTVAGITFYEHGETPGLGGEVDNPNWKGMWKGRKVFSIDAASGQMAPSIEVIKGQAGPASDDPYRVDGLSGATITSRGVTHLVQYWMGDGGFGPYLNKFREGGA